MNPKDLKIDEPSTLYYAEANGKPLEFKPIGEIHKIEAIDSSEGEDQACLDMSLLSEGQTIRLKFKPSDTFANIMKYGSTDKRRIKRCKRIMRLYRRKYQCSNVWCSGGDVFGFSPKLNELFINKYH